MPEGRREGRKREFAAVIDKAHFYRRVCLLWGEKYTALSFRVTEEGKAQEAAEQIRQLLADAEEKVGAGEKRVIIVTKQNVAEFQRKVAALNIDGLDVDSLRVWGEGDEPESARAAALLECLECSPKLRKMMRRLFGVSEGKKEVPTEADKEFGKALENLPTLRKSLRDWVGPDEEAS